MKNIQPKYVLARCIIPEKYSEPEHHAKYGGLQYVWLRNEPPHMEAGIGTSNGLVMLNTLAYYDETRSDRIGYWTFPYEWIELTNEYAFELRRFTKEEWKIRREYRDILNMRIK